MNVKDASKRFMTIHQPKIKIHRSGKKTAHAS